MDDAGLLISMHLWTHQSTSFRIPYTAIAQWKTPVDWISFNLRIPRVKNGKSWELAFGTLECYGRDVIGRFSGNVSSIQAKAVTLSPFFFYWTSVLYLLFEIFVLRVCPLKFLSLPKASWNVKKYLGHWDWVFGWSPDLCLLGSEVPPTPFLLLVHSCFLYRWSWLGQMELPDDRWSLRLQSQRECLNQN